MARNPTPAVSCKYGAPMGRAGVHGDPDQAWKFCLRKVRLDSGGYDSGGAYWGIGQTLYWAGAEPAQSMFPGETRESVSDLEPPEMFFRACGRAAAKAHAREMYPNATFYR
jgi:hypothetical protein